MKIWQRQYKWMLALVLFAALLSDCGAKATQRTDEALAQLARIDQAVTENGWDNKSLTEITQTHYSDAEGNEIVYYLCHTAYVDGAEAEITELNTEAFQTIITPDAAKKIRTCEINGMAAAIYDKDNHSYLCWTATPEYSFALEYDPKAVDETEIIKMAASVSSVS